MTTAGDVAREPREPPSLTEQNQPMDSNTVNAVKYKKVVLLMVVMEQMVMEKNNKMWYKKQCGVEDV
ncbi:hypothetical protein L2E82_25791 [Cichorium intybus]|uniref:Uncharacterized protein n=1 Tax=Cichorium intybus TaxID=13427 RepID=A0ACB9E4W3_CICIN|nr:hypothetical protein L2E82_25791 [Cichorium intybus]